ncbi:FAD-dependent oxidoreductase [bacterium]|nr:FAD-dependent oxidoreductase [bacterium]
MSKIVIIGGNVAGLVTATKAREADPEAKITVLSQEPYLPYRRPAIPSLIAREISDIDEAAIFPSDYLQAKKIDYLVGVEATALKVGEKFIHAREISTEKTSQLPYDAAILATGSSPIIAPIKGADKKGVCTFTTYEATKEIMEFTRHSQAAVVVGAGFIGLEIAEALLKRGLRVYFNVRSRILRRLLEPEFSAYLSQCFEREGLKMLTGEVIGEIGGKEEVEYVTMKGERIPTQLVVLGTGVKPNVDLAKDAGIELGETGAIKVDDRMSTSAKDVYAAGDCAESLDLTTGKFTYTPVGSIAACAGAIAGTNAAGGGEKTPGFLRAQEDRVFGQEIVSIGHSSTTAKQVNLPVHIHDLKELLPQKQLGFSRKYPAQVKVIVDKDNKVVGAQVIAPRYASQYSYPLFKGILQQTKLEKLLKEWEPSLDTAVREGLIEE